MLVGRRLDDRHGGLDRCDRDFAPLAPPFVAAEIEHAIAHQRSADDAAELLLVVGRLGPRQRRTRIPVARTNHHERRSVDLVGAALGDHAGDARRMTAELRRELIGDELHFLDGLEREAARPELRRALQREPLRVVVGAVDVGAEVPHFAAADVDGVGARHARDDVRVDGQQPEVVALFHRQRLERLPIDRARHLGRRRLHDRRIAGDGDRLLHRRELHLHVDHGALAGVEREVIAELGREAGQLGLQFVAAFRRQRRKHVAAAVVGRRAAGEAGGHVADGDGDAGQDRLLLVGDDTLDAEGRRLRRRRVGHGEKRRENEQPFEYTMKRHVTPRRASGTRTAGERERRILARAHANSLRARHKAG